MIVIKYTVTVFHYNFFLLLSKPVCILENSFWKVHQRQVWQAEIMSLKSVKYNSHKGNRAGSLTFQKLYQWPSLDRTSSNFGSLSRCLNPSVIIVRGPPKKIQGKKFLRLYISCIEEALHGPLFLQPLKNVACKLQLIF